MLIFLLVCVILAVVFLFLIAPGKTADAMRSAPYNVPYAHRGIHDGEFLPENSLPAFQRALELGYGIELDVWLTLDNHLIVFHDEDVSRVCGVQGKITQMTLAQVKKLCLMDTEEKIPTLDEALTLIDGKAPLIVEMKSNGKNHTNLPRALCTRMEEYRGPYCVESFDPLMLLWYRNKAPQVVRGQLTMGARNKETGKVASTGRIALSFLFSNVLSRPNFIAREWSSQNVSLSIVRLFHPVLIAWTIRKPEEWQAVQNKFDLMIFEAFLPFEMDSIHPAEHQKEGNDFYE